MYTILRYLSTNIKLYLKLNQLSYFITKLNMQTPFHAYIGYWLMVSHTYVVK